MPASPSSLGIDVAGCPNACRHCFLDVRQAGTERGADFVRMVYDRFSDHARRHGQPALHVALYMHEPFFHTRWREMLELEDNLSGRSGREELRKRRWRGLATVGWRIAREAGFARWLKDYGYDILQLTFFGLRDTHDWFACRRGAFDDLIMTVHRAQASWRARAVPRRINPWLVPKAAREITNVCADPGRRESR